MPCEQSDHLIFRKIIEKLAYFSTTGNHHTLHHDSPRIHHNFTTIYHAKNTVEIAKRLQKPSRYPAELFSAPNGKLVETCNYP
jgi:hypothetical protein